MTDVVAARHGVRIERVVTSGTFSLDGGTWDVDNNVWVVGDDKECLVVDAAHQAEPILAAVGDRELRAIVCTHGHNDHLSAVRDVVAQRPTTPVYLHPADRMLWDMTIDVPPDRELHDGDQLEIAGTSLRVLHTPGHSPGACCFVVADLGVVLTGDTLFQGGPGATGRSYSDYPTIASSIRTRLLTLPEQTVVLTGHGDSTTIQAEKAGSASWTAPPA